MEPRARLVKARRTSPPPEKPTEYSPEVADAVCRRLAQGLSLKSVAIGPDMPRVETIAAWVIDDVEGFAARYERARKVRAMLWEDEILDIADNGSEDWKETARGMAANAEHLSRSKLRVDVRKWLLGKWLPEQFGERLGLASDENNPMTVTIVRYGDDPAPA